MISANRSSRGLVAVSVFGPSGAGKSQVARALAVALGEETAARVPADSFLVPRPPGMPMAEYRARPLAWDWALLAERLALPLGTRTTTPDFDFDAFVRRDEIGGLPFTVRPLMIVDAMAPYPDADLTVRLDVPDEVRRERLIDRDRRWGTRVIDRWDQLEATWTAARAAAGVPALELDGTRPIAESVHRIAEEIHRLVRARGLPEHGPWCPAGEQRLTDG